MTRHLAMMLETQGGEIALDLPAGLKADEVRLILDEKESQPIGGWRNENGKLILPIAAGSATFRVRLFRDWRPNRTNRTFERRGRKMHMHSCF